MPLIELTPLNRRGGQPSGPHINFSSGSTYVAFYPQQEKGTKIQVFIDTDTSEIYFIPNAKKGLSLSKGSRLYYLLFKKADCPSFAVDLSPCSIPSNTEADKFEEGYCGVLPKAVLDSIVHYLNKGN